MHLPYSTAERRVLAASIIATTASVLPAFLTGAVGVQLRSDLEISEAGLGLAIGGFFTTAALGSMLLGRAAQALGATIAMRLGLAVSAATLLSVAAWSRSLTSLLAVLAAGGVANALTQPSANLLLAERVSQRRLGFAMALKQAGMPTSALLGGVAVPTFALTVGWRWAYVAAGALALAAMVLVPAATSARPASKGVARSRPDQGLSLLVLLSVSAALGAAVAGALATFLVSGAEASGMAPALAGLLLTGGGLLGVASRLWHGHLADLDRIDPLARVTLLLAIGSVGIGSFALQVPAGYVAGTVLAFACGWSWPGLFNLAIVLANPSAPAAATGVTQTGVYLGALAGPLLFGLGVDRFGYSTAWAGTATALLVAAAVLVFGRRQVAGTQHARSSGIIEATPTEGTIP